MDPTNPTTTPFTPLSARGVNNNFIPPSDRIPLRQALGVRANSVPDIDTEFRNWFRRLQRETSSYIDTADDPYLSFVLSNAQDLERNAQGVLDYYRDLSPEQRLEEYAALICCLLTAAYEATGRPNVVYDTLRAADRSRLTAWLRMLRAMLVLTQQLQQSQSVDFELEILNIDISGIIHNSIMSVFLGPVTRLMVYLEAVSAEVSRNLRLLTLVDRTRCQPLIRMWSNFLNLIFGGRRAFIRKGKSLIANIVVNSRRRLDNAARRLGVNTQSHIYRRRIEVEANTSEYVKIDREKLQFMIEVLDVLISSLSLFSVCRLAVPDRPNASTETRPLPTGTVPGGGSNDDPDRDDPDRDDPMLDIPGRPRFITFLQNEQTVGASSAVNRPPTPQNYIEVEGIPDGEYFYLTAANIEYFLSQVSNIPVDTIEQIRDSVICQGGLTSDTVAALEAAGVAV